jgi:hypothetical protein
MADQLYLSYWLRNFSEPTMLRHYEKLLRLFPFSLLAKQPSTFRVLAVDYSEPIVVEIPYPPPVPIDSILAAAKDFQNADSCYRLETWWDLWHFTDEWKLEPTRVALSCFGPEFDQGNAGISRFRRRGRELRARDRVWHRRQFSSAAGTAGQPARNPIEHQKLAEAGTRFG